jgi:hypothetical protein
MKGWVKWCAVVLFGFAVGFAEATPYLEFKNIGQPYTPAGAAQYAAYTGEYTYNPTYTVSCNDYSVSVGYNSTAGFYLSSGSYSCRYVATVNDTWNGGYEVVAAGTFNLAVNGSDYTSFPSDLTGGVYSCNADSNWVAIVLTGEPPPPMSFSQHFTGGVMSLAWISQVNYSPVLGQAIVDQLADRLKSAFAGKKFDFEGSYDHESSAATLSVTIPKPTLPPSSGGGSSSETTNPCDVYLESKGY